MAVKADSSLGLNVRIKVQIASSISSGEKAAKLN